MDPPVADPMSGTTIKTPKLLLFLAVLLKSFKLGALQTNYKGSFSFSILSDW